MLLSSLACLFPRVAVTDRLRPVFPMARGARRYRFSVNFLSFLRFLGKGHSSKKHILFSFFAPSREINQISPRAVRLQMVHAKAQRREEEKRMV
jgi:hypothetical protein